MFVTLLSACFLPFLNRNDSSDPYGVQHPCMLQEPLLSLGEGENQFEPLNENDGVVMIHGPQGGWHILGSFYIENALQIVDVEYTIEHLESQTLVSNNTYRLAMIAEGECQGYYPGLYGYISVMDLTDGELDTPPELLAYDMLRMTMRINDCGTAQQDANICRREERWIETSLDVLALPDPMDVE